MAGLKEGLKDEARFVRRHHYKAVSCFPIGFYVDTFSNLLNDHTADAQKSIIARVNNPRLSEPNWQATSTSMWFGNLKTYAEWEAGFHAYARFRDLLDRLLDTVDKANQWEQRSGEIVEWDWRVEDSLNAFNNVNCRHLCRGLLPSGKEPLKKNAFNSHLLDFPATKQDHAKEVYSALVDKDQEDRGWIQQFVHPKKAFNTKKSSTLMAKAYFDKIMDEWNRVFDPKEHVSFGGEQLPSEGVQHLSGHVVRRKPQKENVVYSGAGNGLHLLTEDERLFVSPFLEVTKVWLSKQPYLLNSREQYINYLQDAIMDPLLRLGYTVCTVSPVFAPFVENRKIY